ncbi:MAG: DUF6232 family protein [Cyanobacteria bacterium P01_D01_bin.44]
MISHHIHQFQGLGDLPIAKRTLAPTNPSAPEPISYIVESYQDEVLLNATDLLYGDRVYPLLNISSLEVITLRRKRLDAQYKTRKLLGLTALVAGLILAFSPLILAIRAIGLGMAVLSLTSFLVFYLLIGEKKLGKYGLSLEMEGGTKRVLTSHNTQAIQKLYHLLDERLKQRSFAGETLVVNMYTGEVSVLRS